MKAVNDVAEYGANLTPVLAMKESMALSGMRKTDEVAFKTTMTLLVLHAIKQFNATNSLTTEQIPDLILRITSRFYFMRFDELVYVFYQAADGLYGRDFNRIDAGVVMGWLEKYNITEREAAAEQIRSKQLTIDAEPIRTVKPETPSDPELAGYYDRVRAGKKTLFPATPRYSETEKRKQSEAMSRYIKDKRAGLVEDYQKQPIESETDQ